MNEYDKKMKNLDVIIQACGLYDAITRYDNRMSQDLDKLIKLKEKPEKLAKLSPAEISSLLGKAYQQHRKALKSFHAVFSFYNKITLTLYQLYIRKSKIRKRNRKKSSCINYLRFTNQEVIYDNLLANVVYKSHYYACPRSVGLLNNSVDVNIVYKERCPYYCQYSGEIHGPIIIKKKLQDINLLKADVFEQRIIVSTKGRELIEDNGITGFEFKEQCENQQDSSIQHQRCIIFREISLH